MSNQRRILVSLVLALAAMLMSLPVADAGHRLRQRNRCPGNTQVELAHFKEADDRAILTIKGAVYDTMGALRIDTKIFRYVKTHETVSVLIGGSESTSFPTNAVNGTYSFTYNTLNLGPSKLIKVYFKRENSTDPPVVIGPLGGDPPAGFAQHIIHPSIP